MCDKMRKSPPLSDDITPPPTSRTVNPAPSGQFLRSFSVRDNHDCSTKVLNGNSFIRPLIRGCQAPKERKVLAEKLEKKKKRKKSTLSLAAWMSASVSPENRWRHAVTQNTHGPDVYRCDQTIIQLRFYLRNAQRDPDVTVQQAEQTNKHFL